MKVQELITLSEMTTLNRVYQHFTNTTIPVAIMSAYRDDYNPRENIARGNALAADIKNARFGFIFIDGSYIENQGTPEEKKVQEVSVMIIGYTNDSGNLKGNLLRRLMREYEQESAIYRPQGTNEIFLLYNNGTQQSLGEFHPNRVGDYMSKLRGRGERTFVIEDARYGKTWMERITVRAREKLHAEKDRKDIE